MSYDVVLKGSFTFADRECLVAGVALFLEVDSTALHEVEFEDLVATIDLDASIPASLYNDLLAGLNQLASCAKTGSVEARLMGERTSRETIESDGCTSVGDLEIDEDLLLEAEDWLAGDSEDSDAPADESA